MKKLIIIFGLIACFSLPSFSNDSYFSVYDLSTKNVNKIKYTLFGSITGSSEYFSEDLVDLKAAVVIHGGSYRYFLKDPYKSKFNGDSDLISNIDEIKKIVKTLHETYNVKFYICGAGLKKHNISKNDIYDFIEVLPNSTIALIELQNKGYAYIPIGDWFYFLSFLLSFLSYISLTKTKGLIWTQN